MATRILAPRLRHRVDVQARTIEQDSDGFTVEEWVSLVLIDSDDDLLPAEVVPLSGREFVAAQATQAGVTTRITLRYRDDVAPSMRVVHGDAYYNIRAVLPDPTFARHITLMCETGVNDG